MDSFQHQLQEFDPGMIWLDKDNNVTALNNVAIKILGADPKEIIGSELLKFHPEKSRAKVAWLLDSARCPVNTPPPQTMMINTPDRVLLIKVSKMDGAGEFVGTCMVFYDLTDTVAEPVNSQKKDDAPRLLFKLPVYHKNKVMLIDINDVVYFKADGHYTNIHTEKGSYLCNHSLADLKNRLDDQQFVRTHRSYVINICYASAFEKINENYVIGLNNNDVEKIPVSRGNIQQLKKILGLV